jgi:hypothetical protein
MLDQVDESVKTCTKCHRGLPIEAFGPHKHTRDRKESWCHDCKRRYMADRRAAQRASIPASYAWLERPY